MFILLSFPANQLNYFWKKDYDINERASIKMGRISF